MGQKYMYFDHYTTREGLSSNMVTALSQDGNGHVWVATDFGLNRFNGSTFKRFGSASYPSLYRDDILYLHPQGKDGLLLGGYNGFLMRYDAKSDSFADVSPADFVRLITKVFSVSIRLQMADCLSTPPMAYTSMTVFTSDLSIHFHYIARLPLQHLFHEY